MRSVTRHERELMEYDRGERSMSSKAHAVSRTIPDARNSRRDDDLIQADDNARWLSDFACKHARPLRVLHIGNIANNAYRNAALQRRRGIDADVVCYDYYHIMGCPEWEDAEINGAYDAFYPDWWSLDAGTWQRPDWFIQGPLQNCLDYLNARQRNDRVGCQNAKLAILQAYDEMLAERANAAGKPRRPRNLLSAEHLETTVRLAPELAGISQNPAMPSIARLASAARSSFSRYSSPEWRRSLIEYTKSGLFNEALQRRSSGDASSFYDRVVLKLYGNRNLRRRKSGELEGFPLATTEWQRSPVRLSKLHLLARLAAGSALWCALQPVAAIARHNGAVIDAPRQCAEVSEEIAIRYRDDFKHLSIHCIEEDLAAHRAMAALWADLLGHYDIVQGYAFDAAIPLFQAHPAFAAYEHGTIRLIPFEETRRGRLCRFVYKHAPKVFITNSDVLPSADRIPIRDDRRIPIPHAFEDAPLNAFYEANPKPKRAEGPVHFFSPTRHHWKSGDASWLKGNDVFLRAASKLAGEGHEIRITLVEWGQEVDESRKLIDELGLAHCVTWLATLNRTQLWAAYRDADVVVDQFVVPALGGVGYEALILGSRLMTRLDKSTLAAFFGEAPPILNAATVEEAVECMRQVIADPDDHAGLGSGARAWALGYHSTERLFHLQLAGYREMLDGAHSSTAASI